MERPPRERTPDSTIALLADPYGFISKRAAAHGTDVFEARILLRPTLCMTGRDAARLFYDRTRFTRAGAAPPRLQRSLFGEGGVQSLDGPEHAHRKRMLLAIVPPDRVAALREAVQETWRAKLPDWTRRERVVLYHEAREILARAVCAWAGMPLREEMVAERTEQLASLFEGAGKIGPAHWRARRDRDRLEALIAARIEAVRSGERTAPAESALCIIANHRDRQGALLDPKVAAVELLNILRPTIAVAVYITFVAHALHSHPAARARLGDDTYDTAFIQEVRRHYPFFPAVAARVRTDFEWNGHAFPAGRRVLLDLHGTNHDPRVWEDPDTFRPERFLDRPDDRFSPIPQGGGDVREGHRCVGEETTVALMRAALQMLHREMDYAVPQQDLEIDTATLPALPKSGFLLADVRSVGLRAVAPKMR